MHPTLVTIRVDERHVVSGLLQVPSAPKGLYVLAHGAGAGMNHTFMMAIADGLFDRNVGVLRYQFPYMQQSLKRPDRPALAHATVRAAVELAGRLAPGLPLFAGGKSFGGRMTSQAQSVTPLQAVRGLAFLGFPLHPPNQPSDDRAAHLAAVRVPMLFLQGTRDKLAELTLLAPLTERLGTGVTLKLIPQADHSFHVPARSGRTDAQVLVEALDILADWMQEIAARG